MPQNGFHALVGLAVGRRVWPGRVESVLGFTVGAMLPDFDVLPFAIAAVAGHLIPALHRTLTHSLLTAAAVALVGWAMVSRGRLARPCRAHGRPCPSAGMTEPERCLPSPVGSFLIAMGVGMAGHDLLDVVFWFSSVDLLWPVSRWLGWSEVNIWRGYTPPVILGNPAFLGNELAALEPLAFALYLGMIYRLARQGGEPARRLRFVRAVRMICWGCFPLFVVSGALWRMEYQELAVYTPNILLFFPTAFWATIVFRRSLAQQRASQATDLLAAEATGRWRSREDRAMGTRSSLVVHLPRLRWAGRQLTH